MFLFVSDPFQLLRALFVASVKIAGYSVASLSQAAWYLLQGNKVKVGDAIGELGRGVTDAIAEIWER